MNGVPGFLQLDNLLAYQNGLLVMAAWFITEIISRSTRGVIVMQRVLPALPILVCEVLVFATTSWQPTATNGERMLLGVLLGALTVNGHMLAKKWGLQDLLPFMKERAQDGDGEAEVLEASDPGSVVSKK